jgi:Opioid growth factor receptor (OGFr) conserved region
VLSSGAERSIYVRAEARTYEMVALGSTLLARTRIYRLPKFFPGAYDCDRACGTVIFVQIGNFERAEDVNQAGDQTNWIIPFYQGVVADDRGRSLRQIWRWPDEKLEHVHDYIQWLFPLPEPSSFNPEAPTLDKQAIREFHARPELRANMRSSFVRMLVFYGFELVEEDPLRVIPSESFAERSRNWLRPSNHNHLRITRILRSLRLVGLEQEAAAFFRCLAGLYGKESSSPEPRISEETFGYWRAAVGVERLADNVRNAGDQ